MANKSKEKETVVLASGVFDLLHLGHVRFLEAAKKAGGSNAKLIVIIARDKTAEKRKGKRPIMSENQRCALVESLKIVNCAFLGLEKFDIGKVIDAIKPDVIAVGYDQEGMEKTVRDYVKQKEVGLEIVKIDKFEEDELDSSSKIKQ